MKKLLIGSAVLAALLIKENIAVNAAIEQNETTPKIAVTDKKEKPRDKFYYLGNKAESQERKIYW